MANAEGYRKAIRLMEMASRFNMPVVAFIDTPGAYPGIGAEERGQAEAIADNLEKMLAMCISVVQMVKSKKSAIKFVEVKSHHPQTLRWISAL